MRHSLGPRVADLVRRVREPFASDDENRQVQGYTGVTSVLPGESLAFHVTTNPAQRYRIAFRRWPERDPLLTSDWIAARREPEPLVDPATGAVHCDWEPSYQAPIGADWPSGVYVATLTNVLGRWSRVPFVVREAVPTAPLLVVVPFATYAAGNRWPMVEGLGSNLFHGLDERGRTVAERRSTAVSLNRPFSATGLPRRWERDYHLVRWLESTGHQAGYASGLDLETGRVRLTDYQAVLFAGHDRYWSPQMRRQVEKAVAAGVHLAFLSAGDMYWRVDCPDGGDSGGQRLLRCDQVGPDETGFTGRWRDLGEPEQALLGAQFTAIPRRTAPLVVDQADHWFWAGTGARSGDRIRRLTGGEVDGVYPQHPLPESLPDSYARLASSPYRDGGRVRRTQHTTLYQAPSGAWVFNAGTCRWTYALDRPGFRDRRIQAATGNLLRRMLGAD